MRFLSCFFAAFAISPAPDVPQITSQLTKTASLPSFIPKSSLSSSSTSLLSDGVSNWIAATASVSAIGSAQAPPSQADVQLLRKAFAEFYGVERDLDASLVLLTQVVERWQGQPPDELAGLYRVRGDCYTLLADSKAAVSDYTKAIELLQGPGGDQADPIELPSALLGRARALKSQGTALTKAQTKQAAGDYELSLKLTSREDWDTDAELLEDGATRNPYAAWEWGTVLRQANDWKQAAYAHSLAGTAFDEIGDKPRGVMAVIDAGIDLAGGSGKTSEAKSILQKATAKTKGIEARDVGLLQRLIAKEGEGRMALAALLWDEGSVADAEATLGRACERLEQLQVDASQRNAKKDGVPLDEPKRLKFSIDDTNPAVSMSCSRFKNSAFLDEQLGWSESLQKKMIKLETLK